LNLLNGILVVCGSLSLALGVIGIFVPGLPTTAFLLLSAWLYMKSSPRLHKALLNNKYLGKYISKYQKEKGMTLKSKLYAIGMMWAMILISISQTLDKRIIIWILIGLGLTGTLVMGFIVKTVYRTTEDIRKEPEKNE
jgi:uncharacterized protein